MPDIKIGLIGGGDIGRAHALAFRNVSLTFGPLPAATRLISVFDDSGARADAVAKDFGISHVAPDWVDVVRDPEIQLVDIAVCDGRQADIARAAFAHGKHVLIERSAASSPTEWEALARTANVAGLHAGVCFPYLYNPVQTLARKLIADGELGTITGFRATFDRGSAADAVVQSSADMRDRGIGAQAGQIIALALQLVGPIERVCGMSKAFAGARADARLERTNTREDFVQFLCEFESGAAAHFSSAGVGEEQWLGLSYEVQGALGAMCFDQERMNELDLFRQNEQREVRGYKTIYSGPDQADYAAFHPLPGVGLSFSDQRTFEARDMVLAICERSRPKYDLEFDAQVARVERAVVRSIVSRGWIRLRDVE